MPLVLIILLAFAPHAAARVGDLYEPLRAEELPFMHTFDRPLGPGAINRYGCAPDVILPAAEVFYEVDIQTTGLFQAGLVGHEAETPLFLQLLHRADMNEDGVATSCVASGEQSIETEVEKGHYLLVVDGRRALKEKKPFTLKVDFLQDDKWQIENVAQGVELLRMRRATASGGSQFLAAIRANPKVPGVSIKVIAPGGCATTSQLGRTSGAVAVINAGFFQADACRSVSLLKSDGKLLATNNKDRSAVGLLDDGSLAIETVMAGEDWPATKEAVGGVPRILTQGKVDLQTEAEGSFLAFEKTAHPRSVVGIGPEGELLMVVADGRTLAGRGMTLQEMATVLQELDGVDGLNLDGGGSSSLWVKNQPFDGVVNHPSDNGRADHHGERKVGSVLAVFSQPPTPSPRFLNLPTRLDVPADGKHTFDVVVGGTFHAAEKIMAESKDFSGEIKVQSLGQNLARVELFPNKDWRPSTHEELLLKVQMPNGEKAQQPLLLRRVPPPGARGWLEAKLGCSCDGSASRSASAWLLLVLVFWGWRFRVRSRR